MDMEHLHLWIGSYFRVEDLSQVPAHPRQMAVAPVANLPKSLWPHPEPFPMRLVHQDMSDLLLRERVWQEWTAGNFATTLPSQTGEPTTVAVVRGPWASSVVYPGSPAVPTCYDCGRPLVLYHLVWRDEDPAVKKGYCPGCKMKWWWTRRWREEQWKAKAAQTKYATTEATFLATAEADYLRDWNRDDREWWSLQRSSRSALYQAWIAHPDRENWTESD